MEFLNQIWQFILSMFGSLDDFLKSIFHFDSFVLDMYNTYILPLPEWMKLLGSLGVAIVFVFGIMSIAKKMMKLLIFILVVLGILVLAKVLMA